MAAGMADVTTNKDAKREDKYMVLSGMSSRACCSFCRSMDLMCCRRAVRRLCMYVCVFVSMHVVYVCMFVCVLLRRDHVCMHACM